MKSLMKLLKKQGGVTIIEMLIVVAVIGILAAIAVPNLTGFLGTSKDQSWTSDKGSLQSAVDGYRSANSNLLPIKTETGDTVTTASSKINLCLATSATAMNTTVPKNNCAIDITALVTGGFLSSNSSVASASSDNVTGGSGSYTWVILANGEVTGFNKAANTLGFTTGIYP